MRKILLALALSTLPLQADIAAAQGNAAKQESKPEAYRVDVDHSSMKWEGRKLGGAHQGYAKIKEGVLEATRGVLSGGSVAIAMTTIRDLDLTDPGDNAKLVAHLKSDDFFSAQKHPVAVFKITKVETKRGKTAITGDLTIKGITHPATLTADVQTEKSVMKAKGDLVIDRTLYDIRYRSTKFFADLGDKVIKDEFTVSVDLTANR